MDAGAARPRKCSRAASFSNSIDDAVSGDPARRNAARVLGARMLNQGKMPLLSWHHLEEMLCIDSEANARARVAHLQSMPLLAWMRLPGEREGLGAIVDILATEAIAFDAGCSSALEVRDEVRTALLRSGRGSDAIGSSNWVWSFARPEMMARRPHMGMVAALGGMRSLDETLTVGQLAQRPLRPYCTAGSEFNAPFALAAPVGDDMRRPRSRRIGEALRQRREPFAGSPRPTSRAGPAWRNWHEQTRIEPQPRHHADMGAHGIEQIDRREAAVGDGHVAPVGQPPGNLQQHLPGTIDQ